MASRITANVYHKALLSSALSSLSGTTTGHAIVLSGRSSVGDGGEGLAVWDAASTATADNATVWGSGTGRWLRVFDGEIHASWFGCNESASAATNGAAIQSAIAAAHAQRIATVRLPDGVISTDRTIQLCVSGNFSNFRLIGGGKRFYGSAGYSGTAIVPTFSNAPAINVQGGRGTEVAYMTLIGPNVAFVVANNLGLSEGAVPTVDDTVAANWIGPTMAASFDSRYAPCAGITIDGWSGSAPGTSYPTTHLAYGQLFSSDCPIHDMEIQGFAVGVACQPCAADGNGDFLSLHNVSMTFCIWGVSIGNTQSRSVNITDCKFAIGYIALTNNTHGEQKGVFNGTINNLSGGACIALHKFGSSTYFGPLRISHCYFESLWRIGDVAPGAVGETSITYDHCLFGFQGQDPERGVPATMLAGSSADMNVVFEGCYFGGFPSVLPIDTLNVKLDGCTIAPSERVSECGKAYVAIAHNATAGGFIPHYLRNDEANRIVFGQADLTSGTFAVSAAACRPRMKLSHRDVLIPAWTTSVMAFSDDSRDEIQVPHRSSSIAKNDASVSSIKLTRDATKKGELVITLTALTDADAEVYGWCPGDVIVDSETHTTFFIRAREQVGGVGDYRKITAEIQNNWKLSGGVYVGVTAFSETVGTLYRINARLYTPKYPVIADLTAASAVLATAGRADGYAGFLESDIAVGDRVVQNEYRDRFVGYSTSAVSARSNAGKTITLAGAVDYTIPRKRIALFSRVPPANSATR